MDPGPQVCPMKPILWNAMSYCWWNKWMSSIEWRRKWQPTPVFLPGKSHGQRSLALVGVHGEEERKFSRMAGIIPFGLITHSMLTRCWKAAWTKWNSFVLLVCTKSLNSSVPASPFSYAKAEASIMKLSKQHGVFCHKRQFLALAKQILCKGAGVSAFTPWDQLVICNVTWISVSSSCLNCTSNSVH